MINIELDFDICGYTIHVKIISYGNDTYWTRCKLSFPSGNSVSNNYVLFSQSSQNLVSLFFTVHDVVLSKLKYHV